MNFQRVKRFKTHFFLYEIVKSVGAGTGQVVPSWTVELDAGERPYVHFFECNENELKMNEKMNELPIL